MIVNGRQVFMQPGSGWTNAPQSYTLDSIDKAADELTRDCVQNVRAQQNAQDQGTMNGIPQLPGLTMMFEGFQKQPQIGGSPVVAPIDPERYARAVYGAIPHLIEQDYQQYAMQLKSIEQINAQNPGSTATPPKMPDSTAIRFVFPLLQIKAIVVPNKPSPGYPNGAAVLRAQENAAAEAAKRVRADVESFNRLAASWKT
jgi:hypothetical protein